MRRQLENIFNPKSIAVIGASSREGTAGQALFQNLKSSGFEGRLFAVNPRHETVQGYPAYPGIDLIPEKVDLAIIVLRWSLVAEVAEACGLAGAGGLMIAMPDFNGGVTPSPEEKAQVLEICKRYGMRLLGPGTLGFLAPHLKLNASLAPGGTPLPGNLALISQSDALIASVLDWSAAQQVGFSYIVSVGNISDIGFADLIDFFGADAQTACILIYMESLVHARRFMSAARSFARNKPIIVLKSGRSEAGGKAALSHTGFLAGNDDAYDAAFKRAGIIRVDTVAQLFNIAHVLALQPKPRGNRLAIITNAGGAGILATDYLEYHGGQLARFSPTTTGALGLLLPESRKPGNPVDLLGSAGPEPFEKALKACLSDPGVDAVLVILAPQYTTEATESAIAVARAAKGSQKPVLAAWMGESYVFDSREAFEAARIPCYRYPESAVDAFLRMWRYSSSLELLYETPPAIPKDFSPDFEAADTVVRQVLQSGRSQMTAPEARLLLEAYQIPVNPTRIAYGPGEAIAHAKAIGYPVVMKVVSPDIAHKTDVGGVILNLSSDGEVERAFDTLLERVALRRPSAKLIGMAIEKMVRKPFELLLGARKDPVFGPVIIFGRGGVGAQVYKDTQMGLPPLNMALAQQIVEHTQFFPLLRGYRGLPGINLLEIDFLLCKFSYLVMDFPEIREIDINPYMADHLGGLVVDTRIILDPDVARVPHNRYQHLVISPYPGRQYTKTVRLKDGSDMLLRPVRPEDEPAMEQMLQKVSADSLYMRFFGLIPKMSHTWMVRFTHIDYDREIAIVAETPDQEGKGRELAGVVRIIEDAWRETAEYAILIADAYHGKGLGSILTDYILEIARQRKIKKIVASVLAANTPMIRMFERRGFVFDRSEVDIYDVELDIQGQQ
ncbi:MAG: GNAT family N-acetyltransferase [Saprospiraceae bacterium]